MQLSKQIINQYNFIAEASKPSARRSTIEYLCTLKGLRGIDGLKDGLEREWEEFVKESKDRASSWNVDLETKPM